VGIGVSIVLIAVGAVLAFAVTAEAEGIEVSTVGWILMIVGALGLLLSLLFLGDRGFGRRRAVYVDEGPDDVVVERRARRSTTVVEDDEVAPGPPPP
jgi:hypothetical protein